MDKDTRNKLQRATQQVRRILEEEFAEQLEGTFDVLPNGKILPEPGKHLDARQRLTRRKLVDAVEHIKAGGKTPQEAVDEYTREAAFTFLNRFVALRMLEARALVQECVSKGDTSSGFKEFCGLAPGLSSLEDGGYRLYLECLFDELTVEVKVLFDRRDSASLLWPGRGALTELLDVLGQADLVGVWSEDETIGWVYQYFNSGEERKKMREESQAPRNSHELAVRNQFFTPRYVVEFLTDNTLGRIWYEMRRGQTRLVEQCQYLVRRPSEVFVGEDQEPPIDDSDAEQDLSQDELLQKTVYIPYRAKKDPRDLKILDPACGSGHFLLYAFDLLISIYDEAWHDDQSPEFEVTGRRLSDDYPELMQLRAILPGLVMAHNLHGIDIDPRAAQIAALALWMRGQRAFNDFQISAEQRCTIVRSNIVCAEPMPGEAAFLDEFITEHLSGDAEGRFLASLVRKVFEVMKLAGEAGSLLKIEVDIAEEVAKAKQQWLERPEFKQQTLFDNGPASVQQELDLTRGITDESFWEEAEQRIYDALRDYSEQAERGGGFQRRLFVADTARGFAFVDLSRQSYDVILMNPPFGETVDNSKNYIFESYEISKFDIAATFAHRAASQLTDRGLVGKLTNRALFFGQMLSKWREVLFIDSGRLCLLADLGLGVLDNALVETAAIVYERASPSKDAVFLRAQQCDLRKLCVHHAPAAAADVFVQFLLDFKRLPDSPFAYWIPATWMHAFGSLPRLDECGVVVKQGMQTADNFRFVRLWWEVSRGDHCWYPFSKGGGFGPQWKETEVVVNWHRNGLEVKAFSEGRYGTWTKQITNTDYFFRPGLTYPPARVEFSPRVLSKGCAVGIAPIICFDEPRDNTHDNLMRVLAILSSSAFRALVNLTTTSAEASRRSYREKAVAATPTVDFAAVPHSAIQIIEELIVTLQQLEESSETSRWFSRPRQPDELTSLVEQIRSLRAQNDAEIGNLYGFTGPPYGMFDATGYDDCELHLRGRDRSRESYSVGIAFGHFSSMSKPEPERDANVNDVYEIIQRRVSFGMASGEHVNVHPDVLVDDLGHSHDLATRAFSVIPRNDLETQDGDSSDEEAFRKYFRKSFFSEHIKKYTLSRRKAPIYWQLGIASGGYSVWLYYHRFTRDTFFQVLNEYVKPKLNHERQKLDRLVGEAGGEPTRSQRKEIEDQEKFVAELTAMAEEVERIAPLWNPNLDDGVIINFAPLWRLVPQNKSWQKECKSCWDKLVKGEYDWAHLAMHLWPERVVPKCVTDASLAIAHGLEEVFWGRDDRDRFQPKEEPQGGWDPVIKKLVNERTSPAVTAALESLLTAPAPAGSSKSRRRKATT